MSDIEKKMKEAILNIEGYSSSKFASACYEIHRREMNKMYTSRQLEMMYAIGIMNQEDLSMDKLAEQLPALKDRLEMAIKFVEQNCKG